MIEAFTLDRCLWASDWPYLRAPARVDYGVLLKIAGERFGDAADRRKLMWETPAQLFGFTSQSPSAFRPPIPPAVLPTIFDPLVRGPSPESQKPRRPGSIGLGLHVAREVVAAHGGAIDVKSSTAAGTVFTVRLPRRRAAR